MFIKKLEKAAIEFNIDLSEKQMNQIQLYCNILLEWNKKINLTAITEPKEIIIKHFIDSLTINKYINTGEKLVDIGTGAGFPGIPIKIIRDDIQVVLVDSLNKRINFLNNVIEELDLKNINTVHARAEEFGQMKDYREKFDISTSRAVANLATLSEYLIPLIKVGGKSICMKGAEIETELNESQKAISTLGAKVKNIELLKLPDSDYSRNIIILKKESITNKKYPRKAGTPAKEPIK